MKTSEAIAFFGNKTRLAKKIGYTRQAIYHWGEYPPVNAQLRIRIASEGALELSTPMVPETPKA